MCSDFYIVSTGCWIGIFSVKDYVLIIFGIRNIKLYSIRTILFGEYKSWQRIFCCLKWWSSMGYNYHIIVAWGLGSWAILKRHIRRKIFVYKRISRNYFWNSIECFALGSAQSRNNCIGIVVITRARKSSTSPLCEWKNIVVDFGYRHGWCTYKFFESIKYVGMLDNIWVYTSRSDTSSYNGSQSSYIPKFSQRIFFFWL